MRLVTPEQIREMDRRTIEDIGISGAVLMERAALGAVELLVEHFGLCPPARVGLLCGAGNNAGDGFAMARMLAARGFEVSQVLVGAPESLKGDAAINFNITERLDLGHVDLSKVPESELPGRLNALPPCEVWCDALLGTGLDRNIGGRFALAVDFLNQQPAVLAVDIVSGLNALDGRIMGAACVRADVTASFGLLKLGQAMYPGRAESGRLRVVDIGLPEVVIGDVGWEAELLTHEWARQKHTLRPPQFHKGAAGKLLILAGSQGKAGAALLAVRGALVGGAGLLTVGTAPEVVPLVAPSVPEAMAAALLAATADPNTEERLYTFLEGVDIVAMGPGIGTNDGTRAALDIVLGSDVSHVVLDADALNLLAATRNFDALRRYTESSTAVLTPHPGEMARLCHTTIEDILANPLCHTRGLARDTGAIVVLKIAATIIAGPAGRLAVNNSGNPGMATGGMGDALTGLIAASLAQHGDPFEATCLAVYAHGAAGDLAALTTGQRGLSVTALLDAVPAIWRGLE